MMAAAMSNDHYYWLDPGTGGTISGGDVSMDGAEPEYTVASSEAGADQLFEQALAENPEFEDVYESMFLYRNGTQIKQGYELTTEQSGLTADW